MILRLAIVLALLLALIGGPASAKTADCDARASVTAHAARDDHEDVALCSEHGDSATGRWVGAAGVAVAVALLVRRQRRRHRPPPTP